MSVSISKQNSKMGDIPSVSLPAGITCGNFPCYKDCYARKLEQLRPNVHESYERNYKILKEDPETFWREVEAQIMLSRFFRWHVSGDIPNKEYLNKMIEIAERNKHCEMLCFTKKYDIVNDAVESGMNIPENLHLIFSAWRGLTMKNPHNFPEAHVKYRDGSTTAASWAVPCNRYSGNCAMCASVDTGCWVLKNGEQVVFNQH